MEFDFVVRNKFVQRRIEQADGNRMSCHDRQGFHDVFFDVAVQFVQRGFTFFMAVADDHFTQQEQRLFAVFSIKHVFRTEKSDAGGAETHCLQGICRGFHIGANVHLFHLVHNFHQFAVRCVFIDVDRYQRQCTFVHEACGSVQADPVAFMQHLPVAGTEGAVFNIDLDVVAAHDAAFTPAARNECRVRGHTAFAGQNGFRSMHTFHVFRGSFVAYQDDRRFFLGKFDGSFGIEYDDAFGAAGAGRQAFGDRRSGSFRFRIEARQQQFDQLVRADAHDGGVFVDQAFFIHIHGHFNGRNAVALADAALEHIKCTAFDSKLDVLHVFVMLFEFAFVTVQFFVQVRHERTERGQVLALCVFGEIIDRRRRTDTRYHVFALCIYQVFAVKMVVAVARVAGECHTGSGVGTHVAEHHSLHVDGRTPVAGYFFNAAVFNGSFTVPAAEYGADTTPELVHGIFRETYSEHVFHRFFKHDDQCVEVFGSQIRVAGISVLFLDGFEFFFQDFPDTFSVFGVQAGGFFHHHVGIHHDEAAVCVVSKPFITGLGNEPLDRIVVEADIQHGIHHAGHGSAGARAYGQEQGIRSVAKGTTHQFFHFCQGAQGFLFEAEGISFTVVVEIGANFRGNCKTGRHRQ